MTATLPSLATTSECVGTGVPILALAGALPANEEAGVCYSGGADGTVRRWLDAVRQVGERAALSVYAVTGVVWEVAACARCRVTAYAMGERDGRTPWKERRYDRCGGWRWRWRVMALARWDETEAA